MIGAFVGDAAGAPLEFRTVTEASLFEALKFEGGGKMRVAPGQVTDDSEMAMCILHSLTEADANTLDVYLLEKYYALWRDSDPFDMGITTRKALRNMNAKSPEPSKIIAGVRAINY